MSVPDNSSGGLESKLAIGNVEYRENEPVTDNKQFAMGIIYLIESDGAEYDEISIWNFRRACEQFEVTCQEMIDAYWKAYSDPYVGKEGIQFRHLYKHIEQHRTGGGKKYTYDQMIDLVTARKYPQEAFKLIEEKDAQGRKKWVLK